MHDQPYSTQVVPLLEQLDLPPLTIRFWDIMYKRFQRSESGSSATDDGHPFKLFGRHGNGESGRRVFVIKA